MNRVCEILGIKYPIIQAPMSAITCPELCAAVSNAGGLGVLGPQSGNDWNARTLEETAENMRQAIRDTRKLTDKPFGVNIFPPCYDPEGFSVITRKVMREENVPVAIVAGELDIDFLKTVKEEGFTVVFRDAHPTVEHERQVNACGYVDIFVAEGCDVGGGMPDEQMGTMSSVALALDTMDIPVMAAGGIVARNMVNAMFALGAEGVFCGSLFILSEECRAAMNVKEDIMNTEPDKLITFSQGPIHWRTTPHKYGLVGKKKNEKGDFFTELGSFEAGMYRGDLDAGVISCSNTSYLVKKVRPCKEIIEDLMHDFSA